MPPRSTRTLSDKHEQFLVDVLGGHYRRTPGSGNQFNNQTDVRGNAREEAWAFAIDGKATEAKSISVKLSDWEKVVEQSHDEEPALALRWYTDGTLRHHVDLIAISLKTFADLVHDANRWREHEDAMRSAQEQAVQRPKLGL